MSIKEEMFKLIEEKENDNLSKNNDLLMIYVNALESFVDDDINDNISVYEYSKPDIVAKYKNLNIAVKHHMRKYRKHIKSAEFDEARKCILNTCDVISDVEKDIRGADDGELVLLANNSVPTITSVIETILTCTLTVVGALAAASTLSITIIGGITGATSGIVLALAAPSILIGTVALGAAAVRNWARKTYDIVTRTITVTTSAQKTINSDQTTEQNFNKFRNEILANISDLKKSVHDELTFVDTIEAEYKLKIKEREEKLLAKNDKTAHDNENKDLRESVSINTMIQNINEAFVNGSITFNQREDLLSRLSM